MQWKLRWPRCGDITSPDTYGYVAHSGGEESPETRCNENWDGLAVGTLHHLRPIVMKPTAEGKSHLRLDAMQIEMASLWGYYVTWDLWLCCPLRRGRVTWDSMQWKLRWPRCGDITSLETYSYEAHSGGEESPETWCNENWDGLAVGILRHLRPMVMKPTAEGKSHLRLDAMKIEMASLWGYYVTWDLKLWSSQRREELPGTRYNKMLKIMSQPFCLSVIFC